jgi:hypothetical protein
MPTREELAEELTKAQLRQLAEKHDVDVSAASSKAELVEAVVSSDISDDQLAESFGGESLEEDEDDEDGEKAPSPSDSFDPMLVDPEAEAASRVEGTTSDAATRQEGETAADTPADSSAQAKSSDAGAEAYPFPTAGDVEVATVDPGSGEGEFAAPLEVEDWVTLGEHERVPDRLVGHTAVVLDAPKDPVEVADAGEQDITVRTRDEINATLTIPRDAIAEVHKGGRIYSNRG